MLKIRKNRDTDYLQKIEQAVEENGFYCPCLIARDNDTLCMCKEFREKDTPGFCRCRRFEKYED